MLKLEYKDYTLDFKFEAGTSRGILKKHPVYFIRISENGLLPFGYGEAAPLERLSPESHEDLAEEFERICGLMSGFSIPKTASEALQLAKDLAGNGFPSVRFALEMALLDLMHGGRQLLFDNYFYKGKKGIPINGLIWMGEMEAMMRQFDEKLAMGFTCIKVKVGAIDWTEELGLIEYIRSKSLDITLRLDANGGFPTNEAFVRLSELEKYNIHSIEQPIMPRQSQAMQLICVKSKTPIALDEELIGIDSLKEKRALLQFIRPSFIVLKPTLLGGIQATQEWISLANELGIGWWVTSALESNIGLNAICQFTAQFPDLSYQGLGTGQLYHNNIKSPLQVKGEGIRYNPKLNWDLPFD